MWRRRCFACSGVGRGRPRAGLGVVLLGLALGGAPARAAAALRFEVPAHCGTEADFRRQLAALAGSAAQQVEPSVLQIREQGSGSFQLHLEVLGEVRELVDPNCQTLLRTAAVVTAAAARGDVPGALPALPEAPEPPPLSAEPPAAEPPAAEPLAAEPLAAEQSPPAPAPRPPALPPTASLPMTTSPPEANTPRDPRRATFALGAGIGVSAGTLPGTSAALELRAGLEPAPVGVALTARYWPGSSAVRQGRNVHVTGLGGRAAALVALGRVLHASLGLEIDRLSGSGREGVSGRNSDTAWRVAMALDLNAIPWSVERLRLELGAGAQLALVRPRFLITGFGDVYRVPPVGGAAIIRGVWLFP